MVTVANSYDHDRNAGHAGQESIDPLESGDDAHLKLFSLPETGGTEDKVESWSLRLLLKELK